MVTTRRAGTERHVVVEGPPGASRAEVRGTRMTSSANGTTSWSPSSAMTRVRAPRARISWMLETTLPCSPCSLLGEGTTTKTG